MYSSERPFAKKDSEILIRKDDETPNAHEIVTLVMNFHATSRLPEDFPWPDMHIYQKKGTKRVSFPNRSYEFAHD